MEKYDFKKTEKKWQRIWSREKIYQVDLDKAKKPFYNLMMFPYPSAEGLHVGNMYAFVHSDAYGRFMRLKGYDVFEPIGLDGFGIHSENYAIKIKEHIKDVSARTEKHFYEQLHQIGNAYDWSRTVETYKPNYYKWTQWLFLKMYEKGLAYRKKSSVNWCPSCKTVLSDEQVIAGKCERCSSETEKRQMEQWFWRITDYAEKLLKNLETIDWSEEVKTIQKNWIGKSEGAIVKFEIKTVGDGAPPATVGSGGPPPLQTLRGQREDSGGAGAPPATGDYTLEVFTTRPDTLFGATYFVLSPEHSLVKKITTKEQKEAVEKYIKQAKQKSDLERTDLAKEKTGVFTGAYAINPVNQEKIPVWIADYVLMSYGTGAIMAVPAHDERDWEFAKKYKLPIIKVVKPPELHSSQKNVPYLRDTSITLSVDCYIGDGRAVNSDFLNGLETKQAIKKMNQWLEEKGVGKSAVNYKLRDWCISRQRYWGPPIPMIYCEKCGWQPVPEKDLPVLLPEMDNFLPDGSGKGPLNKIKEFVNTTCPNCKGPARRETDVSDPFVDSCWYYMRYPCTEFTNKALDKKRLRQWMPVDMYIGGKEHSVLHLLYSRFASMVMHELGYLPEAEPFKKFCAHGLLIAEGAKISKSKGNIVNPDEYIEKYGADAVRMYLMFLGDMRQGGGWQDTGIAGMSRFIKRVWTLANEIISKETGEPQCLKNTHKTIKKVTEDLESLKFNTAIAAIMGYINYLQDASKERNTVNKKVIEVLVKLLAPFAPYLAEELWSKLGHKESIFKEKWPEYDKKLVIDKTINLVIQVNGKLRDTIEVDADINEDEAKKVAQSSEKIKKWTSSKKIVKVIFVKGKLVNIVLK